MDMDFVTFLFLNIVFFSKIIIGGLLLYGLIWVLVRIVRVVNKFNNK